MLPGHCPQTGTGGRAGGGGDAPDREGCCCGAGCALLDGQLGAAEGCRGSGRGGEGLRALPGLPEHRARGPHQPPGQCAAPEAPTWPGLHAAERGGHGGLLLLGTGWSVAGAAPGAAGGCAGNHNASSRARWWRGRAGMRPPAACAQLAQPCPWGIGPQARPSHRQSPGQSPAGSHGAGSGAPGGGGAVQPLRHGECGWGAAHPFSIRCFRL